MLFVPPEAPDKIPEEKNNLYPASMQKRLVEEAPAPVEAHADGGKNKEELLPEKSLPKSLTAKDGEIAQKLKKKRTVVEDEFFPAVEIFFKHLKINLEQKEIIRKNAELNCLVIVPSVVGSLKYFCKAKQKKRCDEKDLSAAYMEAQIKKLPLLFLYTEELSKKAEEMLKSGAFENAVVKRVGWEDK